MTPALQAFLTLGQSRHGQFCLEASGLSLAECRTIRSVVTNNYMDSPDYQQSRRPSPFLQGYHEPGENSEGWVLVEFWGREIPPYVAYLTERLPQALAEREALGL